MAELSLLEELNRDYQSHYAGQSRREVDPAKLESMIERARAAVAKENNIDGLPERLQLYERELDLIRAAQDGGVNYERFTLNGREANLIFNRYARHFAGKSRGTRDLALLDEILGELEDVQTSMTELSQTSASKAMADDQALVEGRLKTYRNERSAILAARSSGNEEEQSGRLAVRANEQFAVFDRQFANKSRLTRRPGLLARMILNLKEIRAEMTKLANSGLGSDTHTKNLRIVDERLKFYENELTEIRNAREKTTINDLMKKLGGAANELFKEYGNHFANVDRKKVDVDRLSRMLDELSEIRRQMDELGRFESAEFNEKNHETVTSHMVSWANEFNFIRQAQSSKS